MAIRRPWTLVVSLCALLAVATSASAECAWVLWTETNVHNQGRQAGIQTDVSFDWKVYETRKACEAVLIRGMESQVQSARDAGIKVLGPGENGSDYTGRFITMNKDIRRVLEASEVTGGEKSLRLLVVHRYSCLPDTLDPRAPKGGK